MSEPKVGEVYEFVYDIHEPAHVETLTITHVDSTHVWYKFPQSRHSFPMTIEMWHKQNYILRGG